MKKSLIPLALLATFAAASCSKSYTREPGSIQNLDAALDSLDKSSTVTMLDAGTGGTFTTKTGVAYTFPPSAFITATGAPVSGSVQITTSEYLDRASMMFSKVYPVSNGEPLVSAGEYYISAKKDGEELSISPAGMYTVKIPRKDTLSGMQFFTGKPDTGRNGRINWQLAPTKGTVTSTKDTTTIITDNTGFTNADKYFNTSVKPVLPSLPLQTFTIALSSTEGLGDDKDIMAFASYDGYNGIWPMVNVRFGVITENHLPKIPVHFVIFAVHNGYIYSGFLAATPETKDEFRINLVKTTLKDFNDQVAALP